jgi:hypothetical protein
MDARNLDAPNAADLKAVNTPINAHAVKNAKVEVSASMVVLGSFAVFAARKVCIVTIFVMIKRNGESSLRIS